MKNVKTKPIFPGRAESIAFLQQLLMYLNSGHTLHEALQICAQLFSGKKQYAFISRLAESIAEGYSWNSSIHSVFSPHSGLYNLGWAKSQSGLLKSANHILKNMQRHIGLIQSLTTVMLYPTLVFIGLIVTIVVYQKIIKPQFFSYLIEEATWFTSSIPLATGGVLLLFLIGTVYILVNPLKIGMLVSVLKMLPGTKKLCNLRIWELLLVFLDIRIAGGFTLWDALSSAQRIYGSTNEGQQLTRIKQSLFENRNLQHVVLRNNHIPNCIKNILYSGLSCNNLEASLLSMQQIISWQLDRRITRLTTLVGPMAIALSGWSVLALCIDILIPIHHFLTRGIL